MCMCVCACMCVSAPSLLITSDVIWTSYDWLNKFYSFYMENVVGIVSKRGLTIEACICRSQPNKSKLALYKLLLSLQQSFKSAVYK